ncbi:MAG: hypothetical protein WKG00_38930 [Polyangiaceae bacterium]
MEHASPRRSGAPPLALALLVAIGLGALSEDQLECEHAIVHLLECCQPDNTDVCTGGCGAEVLEMEESTCIREMSCEQLIAANVCARVESLANVNSAETAAEHAPVCP